MKQPRTLQPWRQRYSPYWAPTGWFGLAMPPRPRRGPPPAGRLTTSHTRRAAAAGNRVRSKDEPCRSI